MRRALLTAALVSGAALLMGQSVGVGVGVSMQRSKATAAAAAPGSLMGEADIEIVATAPSVANISDTITGAVVSSETLTPTWSYLGASATSSTWPAAVGGDTLTAAGSGGTFDAPTPFAEDAVDLEDNRYYTGLTWNPTTNDIIIEAVFVSNDTADGAILECTNSGASDTLRLYWDATNDGAEYTAHDGTLTDTSVLSTRGGGAWQHVIWFFNKDQNSVTSMSGEGQYAARAWGVTGSIDIDQDCSVGADTDGTDNLEFELLKLTAWECAGCITTVADTIRDFVGNRNAALLGAAWAGSAGNTAEWRQDRQSVAYQLDDDGSGRIYRVGYDWTRVSPPPGETEVGVLTEQAITNEFTDTIDMTAGWTCTNCTVQGGSQAGPRGATLHPILFNTGGTAQFRTGQTQTLTVTNVTFSCDVKDGPGTEGGWVVLRPDGTDTNATYFDLTDVAASGCPVGTTGGNVSQTWSQPWDADGDGSDDGCRVGITFTGAGTSQEHAVWGAEGDGDLTFTTDPTNLVEHYIGNCQMEDNDRMSSWIPTPASATAARDADLNTWITDGTLYSLATGTQTLWTRNWWENRDHTLGTRISLQVVDTSAGAGDDLTFLISPTNDLWQAWATTTGGGGIVVGTTDASSGVWQNVATTLQTNEQKIYVDGTEEGTPDTAVGTVVGDLESITIGANDSGGNVWSGWVSQIKLWDTIEAIAE